MIGLLDVYKAHLKVEIALKLQYPFDSLMGLLHIVSQPLIYMLVWRTVAQARGGEVEGFDARSLATYYIVFSFVRQFAASTPMWLFEWRIREGRLSGLLLRPLHPIHTDLAEIISFKLFSSMVAIPVLIVLAIIFEAQFTAPWWMWLLFIPATLLGTALRFVLQYAFSLLGFWTTRIAAIEQMYGISQTFFGGILAPLALLPVPLLAIASVLPFRWILAFPIELALGRLSTGEIVGGFVAQLLWIIAVIPLMLIMWRIGVRHYGAVGG
jgi:ABC-2 type transport system permease protein